VPFVSQEVGCDARHDADQAHASAHVAHIFQHHLEICGTLPNTESQIEHKKQTRKLCRYALSLCIRECIET